MQNMRWCWNVNQLIYFPKSKCPDIKFLGKSFFIGLNFLASSWCWNLFKENSGQKLQNLVLNHEIVFPEAYSLPDSFLHTLSWHISFVMSLFQLRMFSHLSKSLHCMKATGSDKILLVILNNLGSKLISNLGKAV